MYSRLDDGYLLTTEGGRHVTFAWGKRCPDDAVVRFLVDGTVPARRETSCSGRLVSPYVPLAPERASGFPDLGAALTSAEAELVHLPELYRWDWASTIDVGCPYGGGTLRATPSLDGYGSPSAVVASRRARRRRRTDRCSRRTGRWDTGARYVRAGKVVNVRRTG